MPKHILFPSDLSSVSDLAFQTVKEFAQVFQARVSLFHAYQLISPTTAGIYDLSFTPALVDLELSMEEATKNHLETFKTELDQLGLQSELVLEKGPAGELIVAKAKALGCDLIILGSRGLGPISSVLLGSTSTYVLHHSRCPVLVIPVRDQ